MAQGLSEHSPGNGGHDHHDHSHGHGHSHSHGAANENRLFWAAGVTGAFMLVEVAGGLWSGSLALLSDAGHMLTDFVSLSLAWYAFRLGRKDSDLKRTYGYHRFQVLAAFVNGLTLFPIAAWIVYEAFSRLNEPKNILAEPMLIIAVIGLAVNIVAFAILHGGDRANLNLRAAMLHVLGDLLGSVAAIIGALVILMTGWVPIDALLSILVAIIILRSAYYVVKESGHILLEGAPEHVDTEDLRKQLIDAVPEVIDIHHVHIWSLTSERPILTLHAALQEDAEHDTTLERIHDALESLFGISHATVQMEYRHCPDDESGNPSPT